MAVTLSFAKVQDQPCYRRCHTYPPEVPDRLFADVLNWADAHLTIGFLHLDDWRIFSVRSKVILRKRVYLIKSLSVDRSSLSLLTRAVSVLQSGSKMADSPGTNSRFNVIPVKQASIRFKEGSPEEYAAVNHPPEQPEDDHVSTYSQVFIR